MTLRRKKRVQGGLLKIGEIAELTGVPISTIKYYTDLGVLHYTEKTAGGYRLYDENEVMVQLSTVKAMNGNRPTLRDLVDQLKYSGQGTPVHLKRTLGEKITPKKLLIVDDDRDFARSTQIALSDMGWVIKTASSGFDAGREIHKFRPDVVLLDVVMPGINGFDVCRDIKSDKTLGNIKIIITTGYDTPDNRRTVAELGADGYIAKPLDIDKLKSIVEKFFLVETEKEPESPTVIATHSIVGGVR